jgi:hypothetical protein
VQAGLDELRRTCMAARMSVPPNLFDFMGLVHKARSASHAPGPTKSQMKVSKGEGEDFSLTRLPRALQNVDSGWTLGNAAFSGVTIGNTDVMHLRRAFQCTVEALMGSLMLCLPLDAAVDRSGVGFIQERLPPSWLAAPVAEVEDEEAETRIISTLRYVARLLANSSRLPAQRAASGLINTQLCER